MKANERAPLQSLNEQRPTVGVILVNWNGGEFTIPCIQSLLAGAVQPDRIVVVDNGSVDGSAENIADSFPFVTIIHNAMNVGFASANNQGMELLLREGVDYVWLLNSDTTVANDCLAALVEVTQRHPAAAGFSGKIYYQEPKDRLWYAGAIRHPIHRAPQHLLTASADHRYATGSVPVPFISGCCMFIPSGTLRQFGGFIPSYIAYSEDSEWCWRVTRAHQNLYYVPEARLWHRLSASVKKNDSTSPKRGVPGYALYLMNRNHLWTVRKHTSWPFGKPVTLAANIAIQIRNILTYVIKWDSLLIGASIAGLIDGLFAPVPPDVPSWTNVE